MSDSLESVHYTCNQKPSFFMPCIAFDVVSYIARSPFTFSLEKASNYTIEPKALNQVQPCLKRAVDWENCHCRHQAKLQVQFSFMAIPVLWWMAGGGPDSILLRKNYPKSIKYEQFLLHSKARRLLCN